ncbi:hypothetical protein CPC08DRAFT_616566, partial [Agrocybe pediades]
MNTVNKSTGFSPFLIRMGRSPQVIPPLIQIPNANDDESTRIPESIIVDIALLQKEAQDNLIAAKISQALQANKFRSDDFPFHVGQCVRLSTKNRRREYMSANSGCVAK